MFTRNLSIFDRNIRVAAGLILDMWFFSALVEGPLLWATGIACVYLLSTASARYCPIYAALGLTDQSLPS